MLRTQRPTGVQEAVYGLGEEDPQEGTSSPSPPFLSISLSPPLARVVMLQPRQVQVRKGYGAQGVQDELEQRGCHHGQLRQVRSQLSRFFLTF